MNSQYEFSSFSVVCAFDVASSGCGELLAVNARRHIADSKSRAVDIDPEVERYEKLFMMSNLSINWLR
jgi:hypothetical protein